MDFKKIAQMIGIDQKTVPGQLNDIIKKEVIGYIYKHKDKPNFSNCFFRITVSPVPCIYIETLATYGPNNLKVCREIFDLNFLIEKIFKEISGNIIFSSALRMANFPIEKIKEAIEKINIEDYEHYFAFLQNDVVMVHNSKKNESVPMLEIITQLINNI